MKLFVLLPRLDGGGIERMRLHLVREFISMGVEVVLVVGQMKGELVSSVPSNVTVIEIARRGPAFFIAGLAFALYRHRPTHMLCASDDVNCVAILVNILTRVKARIVISNHNTLSEQIKRTKGFARIKALFIKFCMRRLYPKADSIVAVSMGVADDLAHEIGMRRESIRVIYNPVITDSFVEKMQTPLPKSWPKGNEPVMLYVGRLVPEKRLDLLLESFGRVISRLSLRLVIAGEGPLRDWLISQIDNYGWQPRVTLLGFVSNPLPLMRAADVLVLPSDHEGLPNVLIEALGCGTQVVATNCPSGPKEILQDGRYGRLVDVGDAAGLANAISDCIEGRTRIPKSLLWERASDFKSSRIVGEYMRELGGAT